MQIQEIKIRTIGRGRIKDYFEVIKPRETALLVFIGVASAIIAADGAFLGSRLLLTLVTILLASAGANGLTNYLDREIDARMERTRLRTLPSGRIFPPERALFFTASLTMIGLVLAWYLHPYAFMADLVGTAAAVIYRKKVTCVFPQGMIASCAPILMGWFAVRTSVDGELFFLCLLIAVWLPSHIWSVMMVHQEDYYNAGINYFPINSSSKVISRILMTSCIFLYGASMGLYFVGHFGWLYLVAANITGILLIYSSARLTFSTNSKYAWKLYKLSAFPYLGLMFLTMCLDIWLRF